MYVLCTQFPNTVPSSAQDWSCKWSFVFLLSLPVCLPTTVDIIGPWICYAISREHKLWKRYFCFWFFTFWRCRETSRSARNSVYKRDHNLIKNRQLKVSLQYIVYLVCVITVLWFILMIKQANDRYCEVFYLI